MSHLVFEDRAGKLCSIFDLTQLQLVYTQYDFSTTSPTDMLEWAKTEFCEISKNRLRFEESYFKDKETKDFLVNQNNHIGLHLKRFKAFLEEGIDKEYRLVIE
jgi:hypothetical protein